MKDSRPQLSKVTSYYTHTRPVRDPLYFDAYTEEQPRDVGISRPSTEFPNNKARLNALKKANLSRPTTQRMPTKKSNYEDDYQQNTEFAGGNWPVDDDEEEEEEYDDDDGYGGGVGNFDDYSYQQQQKVGKYIQKPDYEGYQNKRDKYIPNERLYKPTGAKSRPASAERTKSRVAGRITRANSMADVKSMKQGNSDYYQQQNDMLDDDDFAVGDPTDELYGDYIQTRAPSRAGLPTGLKTAKPGRAVTTRNRSLSVGTTLGEDLPSQEALRHYDPWRARRVTFYRNGDVLRQGVTYTFSTARDVVNLDVLLAQLTKKMADLPTGVRFLFTVDGDPVTSLDLVRHGQAYVCSSTRHFKRMDYTGKNKDEIPKRGETSFGNRLTVGSSSSTGSSNSLPSSTGSSASTVPGSREGRRILIVNAKDPTKNSRVLLNPKTSQSFEAILNDWGQVLKMKSVSGMLTPSNAQVRSLSQLRNDFADVDEFYLQEGATTNTVTNKNARMSLRPPKVNNKLVRSQSEPNIKEIVPEALTGDPITITVRGKQHILHASSKSKSFKVDSSVPKETLKLDWVYGYRGMDSTENLMVAPATGELIYYVAAVVVLYDKNKNHQRHYTEHTEDISALSLHPKKDVAASGQKQGRSRRNAAHIRIWSLSTLETLQVLGNGDIRIGIASLAFSNKNKGSLVAAVESGENHVMRVWQWESGEMAGKANTHRDLISGVKFHPQENNLVITYGRSHLCFWGKRRDGAFDRADAISPQNGSTKPQTITCIDFQKNGDIFTGDLDGKITTWALRDGGYVALKEIQAHDKSVTCIFTMPEGSLVSGSDTDRRITAWDPLADFAILAETRLPEIAGGVRSIVCQVPGKSEPGLFVGTTKNLILEGGLQSKFQPLVVGHAKQLWALAVHPSLPVFASAGFDRNILKWKNHKPEWRVQVQSECASASFNEDGKLLAVGTIDGHVTILKGDTGKHIATFRTANARVNAIAFAPGGGTLAMASQNGNLYLYKAERGGWVFRRSMTLSGKLPLANFDWSTSGEFIRTQSQEHDIFYWNLSKQAEVPAAERKDDTWNSTNCTIAYDTAGIFKNSNYVEEPTIACCDRSYSKTLLAVGDVDGHLRLFRHPTISSKAGFRETKSYSSYVSQAKFTADDAFIITTGGTDAALMQWKLT